MGQHRVQGADSSNQGTHARASEDEAFEDNFEALAERLAVGIWDRFLFRLQQRLVDDLGTDGLARLKAGAAPYREPQTPVGEITVAMDIGSRP